jgi:hypothetical protein
MIMVRNAGGRGEDDDIEKDVVFKVASSAMMVYWGNLMIIVVITVAFLRLFRQ